MLINPGWAAGDCLSDSFIDSLLGKRKSKTRDRAGELQDYSIYILLTRPLHKVDKLDSLCFNVAQLMLCGLDSNSQGWRFPPAKSMSKKS